MARVDFERYLGIPYEVEAFPGWIDIDNAPSLNCISLMHRVYKEEFGAKLPIGLWAKETLEDTEVIFETVQDGSLQTGDVFVFGARDPELRRRDPGNSPVFHLALYTGQRNETGDPFLLHTTDLNGSSSVIWPLSKFARFSRYEKLHAVKRLRGPRDGSFRAHMAPLI